MRGMPIRIPRRWIPIVTICGLVLGFATAARAQTVVVRRNVNLRRDPSTDQPPIQLLTPDTRLTLIEPAPTGGYLHVRTSAGDEGWVWRRNVDVEPGVPALPEPPAAAEGECPPTGTHLSHGQPVAYAADSDPGLRNAAKKRLPSEGTPLTLAIDDFHRLQDDVDAALGDAHHTKARLEPTRAALSALSLAGGRSVGEGTLVQAAGYVNAAKDEGPESVNCGGLAGYDIHVNVGPAPALAEYDGIVVEMIPQYRKTGWTSHWLKAVERARLEVLVVGGLLYDNEHLVNDDAHHPKHGQPARLSLWEVHPITAFYVCAQAATCDPRTARTVDDADRVGARADHRPVIVSGPRR